VTEFYGKGKTRFGFLPDDVVVTPIGIAAVLSEHTFYRIVHVRTYDGRYQAINVDNVILLCCDTGDPPEAKAESEEDGLRREKQHVVTTRLRAFNRSRPHMHGGRKA
jgi:hypothetical protein